VGDLYQQEGFMKKDLLIIDNVTKKFGGLLANQNISFYIDEGEIIGLLSPNGAGKSTLFNCISCYYNADGGKILFNGAAILKKTPEAICQLGIGRTFQIVRIFKEMTVLENIMIGAFLKYAREGDAAAKAAEMASLFGFTEKLALPGRLSHYLRPEAPGSRPRLGHGAESTALGRNDGGT
jgi:branched-chain amino acid transport system ATP-binding protein